jgi:branched-chain amino acid transport system substrate-binding protein
LTLQLALKVHAPALLKSRRFDRVVRRNTAFHTNYHNTQKGGLKMKRNKLFKFHGEVLLVAIFVFFLFIGTDAVAKEKVLRIGFLSGLSGFASDSERVHLQGGELARDWFNEKGGVTIKGEKYLVELVPEDHKCTADGAVAGATKLVYDQKVKYIAGTIMPFTVAAVATVTEPAHVIRSVGYNCGTPQEFSANTPYTFLSQNGTIGAIISGMWWLKKQFPETKTVSVFIPDDGSIQYLEPQVRKWAQKNGMEVKGDIIGWPLNTVDFTPFALKAAKINADAVGMANGWPAMVGGVLKALREAGYQKPVLGMHFLQVQDVLEVAGKEASDKYFVHGLTLNDPEMTDTIKWIFKKGKAKYGHERLAFWIEGFDPVYVLVQAIEKAQSLDPDDVKRTWEKMDDIDSAYGPSKMGGKETYGLRHAVVGPRPIAGLEKGEAKSFGWIRNITVP